MQETAKRSPGPTAAQTSHRSPQQLPRLTPLLCSAVAALIMAFQFQSAAWAQDATELTIAQLPTSQGPPPRQEPDNRTPAQIAAENYSAPGVRVGSFLLFPELEADEAFNDNVFATSNATGKTGSFVQG